MNKYEIMFIVKPDVEEDARNKLIESFKGVLTANDGTIDSIDEWGLRDLAYEIEDYKRLLCSCKCKLYTCRCC